MIRATAMISLTAVLLCAVPAFSFAGVDVGDAAPDFSLVDLGGKTVTLSAYRGKAVLLNFWGTFCPPCRAEMPSLNRVYLDLKDKGFVVLGVSLDRSEGPVRSLVASEKIAFPIMIDEAKEVYYKKYATFALPLTYLIDKHGTVVQKFFGREEWDSDEMKAKITALLTGK